MNAKQQFADRLNRALDALPDGKRPPSKGAGRQTSVGKLFGVSQKGARKWLEGEAIPSTSKMPQFEKILGCSAAWLWTGSGPSNLPSAQAAYAPPSTPSKPSRYTPGWAEQPWGGAKKLTEAQRRVWLDVLMYLESLPDAPCAALHELLLYFGNQERDARVQALEDLIKPVPNTL